MTRLVHGTKRRGTKGRTTLYIDKEKQGTKIKVLSLNANGEKRQITFSLDRKDRQQLIEALLDHHEQDTL